MRRLLARLSAVPPSAILAAGFVGFLLYAYPGYMSLDSIAQLAEGRSHARSDLQPPIMAFEWGILDAIVAGPVLMLLLQGALALLGMNALLRRVLSPRVAAVTACAVLWFPPVLTTFGVMWKDAQMAAYLLAGTAGLVSELRWRRVLGLVALVIGCAMRHNALAAVVPLVGLLFVWRDGLRWWKRYAISGAVSIAVVGLAFATTRALTTRHVPISPAVLDIVGILATCEDESDDDLRDLLAGTPLHATSDIQAHARKVYLPNNGWFITHGDDRVFDPPITPDELDALSRAWWALMRAHPAAYLRYRLEVFAELVGFSDAPLWSPVWNRFLDNPVQRDWIAHYATASALQDDLGRWWFFLADHTPLFHAYLYLAIAVIVLAAFARDRLSVALLASGLSYELGYFPIAGSSDMRYSHWLITCTVLATLMVVVRRARARPRS